LSVVERGLVEARIYQGQHIALLDLLALGEQDLLQLAVDLGMNADCQRVLHRAEAGQVDRHVLPVDDRDAHRHLRPRGKPGRLSSSGSLLPISISRAARREGAKADCDQDHTTATRRSSLPLWHHDFPPTISSLLTRSLHENIGAKAALHNLRIGRKAFTARLCGRLCDVGAEAHTRACKDAVAGRSGSDPIQYWSH